MIWHVYTNQKKDGVALLTQYYADFRVKNIHRNSNYDSIMIK